MLFGRPSLSITRPVKVFFSNLQIKLNPCEKKVKQNFKKSELLSVLEVLIPKNSPYLLNDTRIITGSCCRSIAIIVCLINAYLYTYLTIKSLLFSGGRVPKERGSFDRHNSLPSEIFSILELFCFQDNWKKRSKLLSVLEVLIPKNSPYLSSDPRILLWGLASVDCQLYLGREGFFSIVLFIVSLWSVNTRYFFVMSCK